jgi:thioredoxin-dependent peroxiredoxin
VWAVARAAGSVGGVTIGVGDQAPEFTLAGTDGTPVGHRRYSLADHLGHPVVLVFYPADHSPVCTTQLTTYSHDIGQFADLGADVLALSPQSVADHDAFAAANGGFAFPLLADVDKAVGQAFGILGPLGFYRRSIFVLDPRGIVTYAHRATAGLTFRPTDEIVAALSALPAS